MLTVCFVGLPQAGKSSMLNALAGKHLLRTGACRTTTEPALIAREPAFGLAWHESELASDDGVELRAIDLPGITDAENEGGTFDAMALEWAKRCDVVCWVSDVRTAFLTTHEKSEWHSLKAALQRKASRPCKQSCNKSSDVQTITGHRAPRSAFIGAHRGPGFLAPPPQKK